MTEKVKIIRDPIHGYIPINKKDQEIIDTPIYQRLKRIRHLPAESVYPGTTHSRFEHSLGVMTLGTKLFEILTSKNSLSPQMKRNGINKYRNTVRYACLLHDVGHTPLSHVCEQFGEASERLYDKYIKPLGITAGLIPKGPSHEWTSAAIALNKFKSNLSSLNVDLELFCRMICGNIYEHDEKQWLNPLISLLNSWTDVDKIDYILRDSKMSGAILANLDSDRILDSFDVDKNQLVISKSGFSVIPQLIYGREALYLWLYTHHAVAYHHALIRRYIDYLMSKHISFRHLFSFQGLLDGADDNQLHALLCQYKNRDSYTRLLCDNIYGRNFYKSLWKTPFECEQVLGDLVIDTILLDPRLLESDLIKKFRFPPHSVFVYEAGFAPFESSAKLWLSIGEKDSKYEKWFHSSIYKQASLIKKTPYIRVSPEIIKRKTEIINYINKWGPITPSA